MERLASEFYSVNAASRTQTWEFAPRVYTLSHNLLLPYL